MNNENVNYKLVPVDSAGVIGINQEFNSDSSTWIPISYPVNFISGSLSYRSKAIVPAEVVPEKNFYSSEAILTTSLSILKWDSFETFEPNASNLNISLEIKIAETDEQKSLGAILSGGGKTYRRQQGFFAVQETPKIFLSVFLDESDFDGLVQQSYEPSFSHLLIKIKAKCIYYNEAFGEVSGYKILSADQWEDYGLDNGISSPNALNPNESIYVSIQTVFDTARKTDTVLEELKDSINKTQYISIHTDSINKIEEAVTRANRANYEENSHDLANAMGIYINHLSSRIMSASNQIVFILFFVLLVLLVISFLLY